MKLMEAAMNSKMPAIKTILDQEDLVKKYNLVHNRKNVSPLGNFWKQNLETIFKDF